MQPDVLVLDENLSQDNVANTLALRPRYDLLHAARGDKTWQDVLLQGMAGPGVLPVARAMQTLPHLAAVERDRLLARAEEEHRVRVMTTIPAIRGLIYDRDGSLLSGNLTTYDIGVSPDMLSQDEDRLDVAEDLAPLLGQSAETILEKISDASLKHVYLAFQVPQETAHQIDALGHRMITEEARNQRVYPQGTLASHILGFVFSDKADRRGYSGAYCVGGGWTVPSGGPPARAGRGRPSTCAGAWSSARGWAWAVWPWRISCTWRWKWA
jgi:hypothetical protein